MTSSSGRLPHPRPTDPRPRAHRRPSLAAAAIERRRPRLARPGEPTHRRRAFGLGSFP